MRKQIQGINIWQQAMRLGEFSGCHQIPQRSFFIKGWQFPICARCTGVLLGQLAAFPLAFLFYPVVWQAGLAIPLAVDGITQSMKWRESNAMLRLGTGIAAGYGLTSGMIAVAIAVYKIIVL